MAKFCCSSCYYIISKEIYCGENKYGRYILDYLSVNDIALLKEYYDLEQNNLDFKFPQMKLNNLIGKAVLKYKFLNEDYYPIQIIKTLDELLQHEDSPTIANGLYKESYECSKFNINRSPESTITAQITNKAYSE